MATSLIKDETGFYATDGVASYTKRPDGTLMQWGYLAVTTNGSTSNGYFPYYGNATLTYPIPFVGDIPTVMVTIGESAGYWNSGTNGNGTLTGTTVSIGGDQNNATKTVRWMAIGRWK